MRWLVYAAVGAVVGGVYLLTPYREGLRTFMAFGAIAAAIEVALARRVRGGAAPSPAHLALRGLAAFTLTTAVAFAAFAFLYMKFAAGYVKARPRPHLVFSHY